MTRSQCLRCSQYWVPRTESPVRCPRCGSPYWNRPKTKPGIPETTEPEDVAIQPAPPRRSGTMEVNLEYAGKAKPSPVDPDRKLGLPYCICTVSNWDPVCNRHQGKKKLYIDERGMVLAKENQIDE